MVDGKIYVIGATGSGTVANGFPLSGNACQTLNNTTGIPIDALSETVNVPITAFAAELDPSQNSAGAQLVFSTLLGGTGIADAGTGLVIDAFGDMVIAGLTYSGDFPVTETAYQSTNKATGKSATNAFLTVLYPLGTDCDKTGGTPVPTPVGASPTPTPNATRLRRQNRSLGQSVGPSGAGFGGAPSLKTLIVQNLNAKHALVGAVGARSALRIASGGGAFKLSPLGMLKVKMTFEPTGLGVEKGSLVITSNDKNSPSLTVNLAGAGEPGVPTLSAAGLTFGTVGIGIPPKTLTLKIRNTGLGALGGSVGGLPAPFAVTAGSGAFGPMPPGGVVSVSVQFTPTQAILSATSLVITTSDPAKLLLMWE